MKTARNAIRLLREFSTESPHLGVSDLSRRLELDRATVHRMLKTLQEERFIEQDLDTRRYRLGSGVLELAQSFLRQHGIVEIAMPHMEKLRDSIGETVGLQILDGRETVCIATAESRHAVRVTYYVGERMPLHATSSGLVFLAHMTAGNRRVALSGKLPKFTSKTMTELGKIEGQLQDILRKGIAIADGSYIEGARTISVPILGSDNDLIAVTTVVAPSQRLSSKQLTALVQPIKSVADRIAADIARVGSVRGVRRQ